jgi:hypothetical protein
MGRSAGVNHSLTPRRLSFGYVRPQTDVWAQEQRSKNVSTESLVALRRENDRDGSVLFFKDKSRDGSAGAIDVVEI